MRAEKSMADDPVIRRVASVRPSFPEDDLSPEGPRARAIAQRVLAGAEDPTAPPRRSAVWRRPQWVLPRAGLALAPIVLALVLFLAGTFSGPDGSGTQSAAAAVIRATKDALALSPGTIFVEDETYVSGPTVHGHPYTLHQVLETPRSGPQNALTTGPPNQLGPRRSPVGGLSYVGGTQEIYLPSTNTIYASSIWGPYLHPGPRPGTYVYRYADGAPAFSTHPVPVTARQRQLLLSGQDCIRLTSKVVGSKVKILGLKVLPPLRGPAQYAETIKQEIANSNLHLVGRTTVHGRPAIELAGRTTDGTAPGVRLYFDPATHLPFEEIDGVGSRHQEVIRLRLRKLPDTATTRRLLSLQALYPSARFDYSHRDYQRADAHGVQVYNQ